MSLVFTKHFFDDEEERFGAYFDENEDNPTVYWLANFLMDDGGCGVFHLLKMSEELLEELLEKFPSDKPIEQYREHFGVIIKGHQTEIDSLLTDEIVSVIPTEFFIEKLKGCIFFIKTNYIQAA